MVWQGTVNPPTLVTIGSIPIISTKQTESNAAGLVLRLALKTRFS